MNEQYKRNCPECSKEIQYTRKSEKDRAEKRNTNCLSCSAINRKKREPYTDEHRKNMSEYKKGQVPWNKGLTKESDSRVKKISESNRGKISWNKGLTKETSNVVKKYSEAKIGQKRSKKTRQKMKLSAIKRIEDKRGQITPNYNSKAIPIILKKANELGITDLQHAENGGEFQVRRYFVDGFSKEKNIVIEYYEPFHKNQVEHDKRRKQEIINYLGCKFIEIKEYKG